MKYEAMVTIVLMHINMLIAFIHLLAHVDKFLVTPLFFYNN
jgi:hypothetical protein